MATSHPYVLLGSKPRSVWQNVDRKHIMIFVAVLVTLFLGALWHFRSPSTGPFLVEGLSSQVAGLAAGYKVLTNVGFHNHTFYFFNVTQPDEGSMMSGTKAAVLNGTFQADIYYNGTTLFLNEGAEPGRWNGLWHYYHFGVENILGGLAALGTMYDRPVMPDRLIIPWVDKWHDKWAMNDALVNALFRSDVVTPADWEKKMEGTVFFEEVVLVDRWAAHRTDPQVEQWMKMPIVVFKDLINVHRPHFFDTARERVHEKFNASYPLVQRIAYIDRQSTNRRLPDSEHEEFLAAMHALVKERDGVEFDHLILEEMTAEEQFRRVSETTILVGIHGNGLTHLMWLPPKSAVIELFTAGSFLPDYQCASEVLDHDYTAVQGNKVLTKAEWEAQGRGTGAEALHNGTPVETDVPFLVGIVRMALDDRLGLYE